jgi:hypothetical protein
MDILGGRFFVESIESFASASIKSHFASHLSVRTCAKELYAFKTIHIISYLHLPTEAYCMVVMHNGPPFQE